MSSFQVNIGNRSKPLADALRDIPARVKSGMRDGFADLATLPADRYHRILAAVTESVGGRVAFKPDEVAIAVGVDADRVGSLLSAGSLTVVILGLRDSTASEFIQGAVSAGLVSSADGDGLLPFCELVVSQRAGVRKLLTRAQLSAVVLPVLTDFGYHC